MLDRYCFRRRSRRGTWVLEPGRRDMLLWIGRTGHLGPLAAAPRYPDRRDSGALTSDLTSLTHMRLCHVIPCGESNVCLSVTLSHLSRPGSAMPSLRRSPLLPDHTHHIVPFTSPYSQGHSPAPTPLHRNPIPSHHISPRRRAFGANLLLAVRVLPVSDSVHQESGRAGGVPTTSVSRDTGHTTWPAMSSRS